MKRLTKIIPSFKPLLILNTVSVIFLSLMVAYGVLDYNHSSNEIRSVQSNIYSRIVDAVTTTTDDILSMMLDPENIYSIDPLLELRFHLLHKNEGIIPSIFHPEPALPRQYRTSPEKSEYWLLQKGGKSFLPDASLDTIKQFLDLLKKRELQNPQSAKQLEIVLAKKAYDDKITTINSTFTLFQATDHYKIFLKKSETLIEAYSLFDRSHPDCVGCHGYDAENPILVFFKKDFLNELKTAKRMRWRHLYGTFLTVLSLLALYLLSFFLIRKSLKEMENESQKIQYALMASGDVLKSLCEPPRLVPFFLTSPVYRSTLETGGGDSLHWLNFRKRYAGFSLYDVSGHGIKETLLNIFGMASSENCKVNETTKTVSSPSVFLTLLNKKIYDFCSMITIYETHYITAINILFDFETRSILLSLAGHPPPILIKPDGSMQKVGKPGFMLGQFRVDEGHYEDVSLDLKQHELLLVFSDGLMEQESKDGVMFVRYFEEKVIPLLAGKKPDEAFHILGQEFDKHVGTYERSDDITYIFFGAKPIKKYQTLKLVAPPADPESNSSALITTDPSYNKCTPVLTELLKNGWDETKLEAVREVLLTITEGVFSSKKGEKRVCGFELSYILIDDILEVTIGCCNECIPFNGILPETCYIDVSDEWTTRFETIKSLSDELYISERRNLFWALFKKE